MATKAAPKKDAEAEAAPKKKGGGMKMIMMLAIAVIFGGGGVGAGLWAMGFLGGGEEAHRDNRPELTPRDDASSSAIAEATEKVRQGGKPDPHVFQASYKELTKNFTSNLRGGQAFVQIGLGMSTYYDKEVVLKRVEKHDMAIRSAILMVLSDQDPLVLATNEGRENLRKALKDAVNAVLTNKEGFGGIEEVFFTSFVTQ